MTTRRESLRLIALFLLAFFGIGAVLNRLHFAFSGAYFLFLALVWTLSIRRRIVGREPRRFLLGLGASMVVWLLLRTLKYNYFWGLDALSRFLWYLYYVPLLLMPLLGLFLALRLDRSEEDRLPWGRRLLYIPYALLVLGILTNDVHQLAFRFAPGFTDWDFAYTHGPLYFAAAAWAGLLLSAAFFVCLRHTLHSARRRWAWVPLLPLLFGAVYMLIYRSGAPHVYNLPEMFCFIVGAFWESYIQLGLIPSNTGYADFFRRSHLSARLEDGEGRTVYTSAPPPPSPGRITVTHAYPIRGGRVIWVEDVTRLHRLQTDLEDVRERLEGEADLLRAENALREERAHIAEQSRIYDDIAAAAAPQIEGIAALVAAAEDDPDRRREALLRSCVLAAYIKRRANLTLLAAQRAELPLGELTLSMEESASNLRRWGADCRVTPALGLPEILPSRAVLDAYDRFEARLETVPRGGTLALRLGLAPAGDLLLEEVSAP